MEPSLGLRVVRGPDWRWENQDGGEGCVGTVAELGREKKAVMVQWDCGIRAWYRSGAENKFDLRILDTAPTGLKFPGVVCSGCYAEGMVGTYWKCAHCYEYHLCHSCYLQGRHCQEHPFFRIQSTKHTPRVKVSPRVDARQVEAKGIFPEAIVVRGENWKFKDQDGGAGSTGRVTAICGWKDVTARSVAKVEWTASRKTNIYRVGHNGKVDLKCLTVKRWGHYYPEHLCTLGSDASVVYFDEDEIVAGDLVTVTLEPDTFKLMQESVDVWEDEMLQMLGGYGIVRSVLKHQRLYASFSLSAHVLCYSATTKLKHCRQGEMVQVTNDFAELHRLQSQESIWDDSLVTTLGQFGRVTEICINNLVEVTVQGKGFLYHPLCLLPASDASLQDELDSQAEMCGSVYRKNFRYQFMSAGITDVALLDGDLETLSSFIYSNTSELKLKQTLLAYYTVTGMIPALKLVLKSGVDPNSFVTDSGRTNLNLAVRLSNHLGVANLLKAGASLIISHENPIYTAAVYGLVSVMEMFVVHAKEYLNIRHPDNKCAPILFAALHGNSIVCSILAAQECVNINMETYRMNIPLHASVMKSYWDVMECLVGWGANLNAANNKGETPLHVVVKQKSPIAPDSVRLKKVQREYFITSGGKTAQGYVIVACFLVQEGADFHVKDKDGLSPYQLLPHEVASLITAYVKIHPGSFHGSLRSTQHSRMCELPPQLKPLPGTGSTASAVGENPLSGSSQHNSKPLAGFLNTPEGKNEVVDSKATQKNTRDSETMKEKYPTSSSTEEKNMFLHSETAHKDLATMKQKPPTYSSSEGRQQSLAIEDSPVESSENYSSTSMSQKKLCLLCEEQTASVKFSPCGHTVMCSVCAGRAKKCYHCKADVEIVTYDQEITQEKGIH